MFTWDDCFEEKLTVEEAADEMNCSKKTAAKMLRRMAARAANKPQIIERAAQKIAQQAAGSYSGRSSFPSKHD